MDFESVSTSKESMGYTEGELHYLESTVVLVTLFTNVSVAYKTHQVIAPLGWPS